MILNIRYIIVFIFLIGFNCFSQNPKIKWGLYGKKTVEERRATFPFSDAKKVLLVAFPNPINSIVEVDGVLITNDSLKLINMHFNIIKSFELPERKNKYYATEIVQLNQNQIDSLSNILINYKLKKDKFKEHSIFASGCYTPRNAILFLDANDKILSYIEICFECHRFIQMPKETIINFNLFSMLEESFKMIDLIKEFMKTNGLKYGVLEK
ncbi:hypothetical protein [Flavobacterium cheonanense]|uniref:hypothetical protein n=1 Tax=Flavobacterium cheonanense TaxID=706183 RepID=UPI0031DAE21C